MGDDVGLGAFLDRESVLQDLRPVLAEGHHSTTGLDLEWTSHGRRLHARRNGISVDINIEVLAGETLHNINLGVIGCVAWTDRQPCQRQDSCNY